MDAKLETIVDQFKARLDELVPTGCREKSLAVTNLETAQMWAEAARGMNAVRLGELVLKLYQHPESVGWRGYLQVAEGNNRPVVAWITLDGALLVPGRNLDPRVPTGPAVEHEQAGAPPDVVVMGDSVSVQPQQPRPE